MTNKLPSLIDRRVCLQKCILKFNDDLIDRCVYGCKNVYPNLMMHSSKLNHSYNEQSRWVQYVQGRLGPQQTSLHNKHPIRKCELLEAQTLGPPGELAL